MFQTVHPTQIAPPPWTQSHDISGFGSGVMIETAEGALPVDWLRPGDQLLTHDHGYQPLLWVGQTLAREIPHGLTHIQPSAFEDQVPLHDLILSSAHRVLLRSAQVALHFGDDEVLAPVKDILLNDETNIPLPHEDYSYYHLLLPEHDLLLAEGLWVESLFPDEHVLDALGPENRAEIMSALGERFQKQRTARQSLNAGESIPLHPRTATVRRRMKA